MQKIANHSTQLYTPASYDCPTPFDLTRLENLSLPHTLRPDTPRKPLLRPHGF